MKVFYCAIAAVDIYEAFHQLYLIPRNLLKLN